MSEKEFDEEQNLDKILAELEKDKSSEDSKSTKKTIKDYNYDDEDIPQDMYID